jgi:O-antigen ligase
MKSTKILKWLLYLNAVIIPIKPELSTLTFLFLSIYWVISIFQNKTQFNKETLVPIFFLSLTFILSIIGLSYTQNIKFGIFEISRSSPIFIIPLVLISLRKSISRKDIDNTLIFFFMGTLLKYSYFLGNATFEFFRTGNSSYFYYTNLARETNSFSYYIVFCYFIVVYYYFVKSHIKDYIHTKRNFWGYLILIYLLIGLTLLESKGVILAFIVINLILTFVFFRQKQKWIYLISSILCFTILASTNIKNRFEEFVNDSKRKTEIAQNSPQTTYDEGREISSTNLRINSLLASIEVIKKHPLTGVGTGDWRDEMCKEYQIAKHNANLKEKTAPHNQYLRSSVKHGLLGFISLLIFFIYNFVNWKKSKENLLLCFTLLVLLCCLSNDLFDTGGGAPFIGFITAILQLTTYKSNSQTTL